MGFLIELFPDFTLIGGIVFVLTILAMWLIGKPKRIAFFIFTISQVIQIYMFYQSNQGFLILTMITLIIFNIRNYKKWKKDNIGN
jgi:nicotinamide riboside transporter PnuC